MPPSDLFSRFFARSRWVRACVGLSLLFLAAPSRVTAEEQSWLPGGVALTGLGFVRPDVWAMARSEVRNPTDEDVELLLAVSFDPTPNVQYTWPVWLPARSRRTVVLPIRAQEIRGDQSVDVRVQLFDERLDQPQVEKALGLLRVDRHRPTTAMTQDRGDRHSAEAATAMRLAGRLPRRIFYLRDTALPPIFVGWQALDNMVVARNEPVLDAAQYDAMRQWIVSGGRLWVMAEQVSPSFLTRLLGEDWTCEIVDHVELDRFQLLGGRNWVKHDPAEVPFLDFEVPVNMARVYAPGWEVVHRVRGWPASLIRPFGLGAVILTTVGPRAWYELEWEVDPKTQTRKKKEVALPPLQDLMRRFNRPVAEPPLPAETLGEFARSQIGYQTLSAATVAWSIGLLAAVMTLAALVLHRVGRLEHVAWLGALLSIVVAAMLMIVGSRHHQTVPLTIAEAEVVQVLPRQGHAIVNGMLAIYSPDEAKGPLTAERGGVVWPEIRFQGSELLRLQWNDLDRWVWDGLKLPKGAILSARFRHAVALEHPVSATLRFAADGLQGTVTVGELGDLTDLVLVTPDGAFAPDLAGDELRVPAAAQLPRGQYVGAATLNTVQERRQNLYYSMFMPASGSQGEDAFAEVRHTMSHPDRTTLYAWADALPLGFSLPQEHEVHATAIVALPVGLEPTPPGERVTVPAGFLPFEPRRGPGRRGTPTIYDRKRREWIGVSNGALVVLRYQLPAAVLPLAVTGGQWTIDIDAAGRSLDAFCYRGEERISLGSAQSVVGRWALDLPTGEAAVVPDADGGIWLGVEVGDLPGGGMTTWRLRDVPLVVNGTVAPPVKADDDRDAASEADEP